MTERRWALLIAGTIACLSLSYGLAVLGEPSSAWFWGLLR